MPISKIFITLLISVLCIAPNTITNGCSWGYDADEYLIEPFQQEVLNLPQYYPFFYSAHYWNGDPSSDWSINRIENAYDVFDGTEANINAWVSYFGNTISASDIDDILYNTTLDEFASINSYVHENNNNVDDALKINALVKYWKGNKNAPSFDYIYLAKSIEPFVQPGDYWEPVERDTKILSEFENKAEIKINSTKDAFIKLRYVYQAMRCAHYSKNYDACIKLYDSYVDEKNPSLITYWCLSLKAGAYWRENKFAESSYYNSIVFDKCPSRSLSAERDFWITDDATWKKCFAMCKNDHEKNILWFLTGINQNNAALPALNEMLKLNPASDEIELLLAREIEKIQRNHMPARDEVDFDKSNDGAIYGAPDYINENKLAAFIDNAIATEKIKNPSFWLGARAFISFVSKNYDDALNYAYKSYAAAKTTELKNQATLFISLSKLKKITTLNTETELQALNEIEAIISSIPKNENKEYYTFSGAGDAYKLAMFHHYSIYLKQRNFAKAEICRSEYLDYYDIYTAPDKKAISQLMQYENTKDENAFDTFLKSKFQYSKDDLFEILGTLAMQQDNFIEATGYFSQIKNMDSNSKIKLWADPFYININDCHDCDFDTHPTKYTKYTLAKKILEIEALVKSGKATAQDYYLLGNAYYNMSHFGNSWMAKEYYLCSSCMGGMDDYTWDPENNNAGYFDCTKALTFYKLAMQNTDDKEFAAKNCFLAAKCEQNMFYITENTKTIESKLKYRTSFNTLYNTYRDTKYYSEVINECKYFEYYVSVNH